jgi:hypothetical protein
MLHSVRTILPGALSILFALACSDGPEAPRSGTLELTVRGLPAASAPRLTVTGPGGYSSVIAGSGMLERLAPGSYTVSAPEVRANGVIWQPELAVLKVDIAASTAPVRMEVAYVRASGSLEVEIHGLPEGVGGRVDIRGPNGFLRTLGAAALLTELRAGEYTIAASPVIASAGKFAVADSVAVVAVTAGEAPARAQIHYRRATATLMARISGLPPGVSGAVMVAGPSGMFNVVTSGPLPELLPGPYSVTALNVSGGGAMLVASPDTQSVVLGEGDSVDVAISYAPGDARINLSVQRVTVTQVVQDGAGQVPLVAGRPALVRVFVRASANNDHRPPVRVRLYRGGSVAATHTLPAPPGGVPTFPSELSLAESWNVILPADQVLPGTSILAEVDPAGNIDDADRADNVFPRSGTPQPLDIRSMPRLPLTFVPVIQSGRAGIVTHSNASAFLASTYSMLPIAPGSIDYVIREPYSTSVPALQSSDGNRSWITVLSEMLALQRSEGTGRHYYGVVNVDYTSGVAGYGYVRQPVAIGWDHLPSGSQVMAHELGHNWGRLHAPCGGVSTADPGYPHSNGATGSLGWDAATGTLRLPTSTDLMGYCSNQWISDYTYRGILDYRLSPAGQMGPTTASAASLAGGGLLIWGRITRGSIVLEPAFEVDAPAALPSSGGAHTVSGFDAAGAQIFSLNFAGESVADQPDGDRAFAFVVPLAAEQRSRLVSIRATTAGQQRALDVRRRGVPQAGPLTVRRGTQGRTTVMWNSAESPVVMVRDAATRRILSFARGGSATVYTTAGEVELVTSDGVRSTIRRVEVQ